MTAALPDRGLARQNRGAARRSAAPRRPQLSRPPGTLAIGLLNNMPDAAFLQTERQFRRLLGPDVALRLFALDRPDRGEAVRAELAERYQSHRALPTAGLDALVITGSEPVESRLQDEPFFAPLSEIVAWAEAHLVSTLFSCLAAHAAVLARDGLARRRLPRKCAGVFPCRGTGTAHPLLAGMPHTVFVPHSRWNDLTEADLVASGYTVLRRAPIGVDLFIREGQNLLVFLQGHPEYDADSLAREYRRDVGRYLAGTCADYPAMLENCFSSEGVARLEGFATAALARRSPSLSASFPPLAEILPPGAAWQADAALLFRNWLRYVALNRASALRSAP